ncbi:nuclear transport factor 2 family protein [Devosia sp.]|uniref:YybH family protein n=1 Tax=Devosia sp. TaxID=1871048 RepID=UPI0032663E16
MHQTLRTLSAAWDAALIANDAPAVAAFMAEDWVYVTETGPVPKADIVGWIAAGKLQHFSFETIGPDRIVIHGDTAIMTARKISTGAWDGVPYTADEWISEIYLRQPGGSWLCVLSQKCPAE